MYCILYIISLCLGEELDVLDASSCERKRVSRYKRDVVRCRYFPCVYNSELLNSTRQHMAKCQHRKQCAEETDRMAAKRESEKRFQTGDDNHGGEFGTEREEVR